MANLVGAIDGTPSMIDELDDNNTPLEHVSKEKKSIDEDGIPIKSPNRIDDVAKSTMEDPMVRPEMQCHKNSNSPDENNTGILALLMSLSQDVSDVMGGVDCPRDEIKVTRKSSCRWVTGVLCVVTPIQGWTLDLVSLLVPTMMEFKGWDTDYSRSSIEGITEDGVAKLVSDLERNWCRNKPTSGLTGNRPGMSKEHGRRR